MNEPGDELRQLLASMDADPPPTSMAERGPATVGESGLDPLAERRLRGWLRERVAEVPVRRLRRRRQRRAAVTVATLASAAAVIALSLQQAPSGAPNAGSEGAQRNWQVHLEHGASLTWTDSDGAQHQTDRVAALSRPRAMETDARSDARLTAPSGATLRLAPGTRVRTPPAAGTQTDIGLERGRVSVNVPPLGRAGSFAIRTRDARVVVHGTRFEVSLRADLAVPRTCVRVQEGRVEVQRGKDMRFLTAGESWGCKAPPPPASDGAGRRRTRPPPRSVTRKLAPAAIEPPPVPERGTLAEENRLLSDALAAERRDERANAQRLLRTLLRRYPDTPLGPEAGRALERLAE